MSETTPTPDKDSYAVIPITLPHAYGGKHHDRYDECFDDSFDDCTRDIPDHPLFAHYDKYAKRYDLERNAAETLEGVALATLNLRIRGLIGLVIGSAVRSLTKPPENLAALKHSDLDVLILQPHSQRNPAPREWGIDWWIRPECSIHTHKNDYKPPTNSEVQLWYDIALQEDVPLNPSVKRKDKVTLNIDQTAIIVDHARKVPHPNAARCRKNGIPPGLYVPDAHTMNAIVNHCNARTAAIAQAIASLIESTKKRIKWIHTEVRRQSQAQPHEEENRILLNIAGDVEKKLIQQCASWGMTEEYVPLQEKFAQTCNEYTYPFFFGLIEKELEYHMTKLQNDHQREVHKNFEYLRLQDERNNSSLLPVLPHSLLSFRGL